MEDIQNTLLTDETSLDNQSGDKYLGIAEGIITGLAEFQKESLVDEAALARAFGVCTRTVRRMVTRYELPPPIRVAGRSMWLAGNVMDWLKESVDQAETDARKAAERIRRSNP